MIRLQHYRCILSVFFMVALLIPASAAYEAKNAIQLKSKIKEVTVYADRAHITRGAYKNLTAGTHDLAIDLLTKHFDGDSVLVDGKGPAEIQGVRIIERKIKEFPKAKARELEKRKHEFTGKIKFMDLKLKIARKERAFMDKMTGKVADQMDKKETPLVETEKWSKMVTFYREKIESLEKEIWDIEKEKELAEREKQKIAHQIEVLKQESRPTKHQVVATVRMKQAGDLALTVSYDIKGPFWFPRYELRINSSNSTGELRYFGEVRQNTDEEWKNVRIKLSTAKPNIGSSHGIMPPQYLDFYEKEINNGPGIDIRKHASSANISKEVFKKLRKGRDFQSIVTYSAGLNAESEFDQGKDQDYRFDDASTGEDKGLKWGRQAVAGASTAVEFVIRERQTVRPGKTGLKVAIMTYKFPVHLRYSCIPKLSQYVYLKAGIVNKTKYPLLEGQGKLFLDGTLVAKSKIKYAAPNANFWVFLGVDRGISVKYFKYPPAKDGNSRKQKVKIERMIAIKNNKKRKIELMVFDQVPIPKNKDIKVKVSKPEKIEKRKDIHYNANGLGGIQWVLHPEAGAEIKLPLIYTMQYPADKLVKTSTR